MRRFFSLLEVCIALAIMAMISSVVGINIHKAVLSHRFYAAMEKVRDKVAYCKKMAFMHEIDLYFTLEERKDGLYYEIGTDETLGIFKNEKKERGFIKDLFFTFNEKKEKKIVYLFSSSGYFEPEGKLSFTMKGLKEVQDLPLIFSRFEKNDFCSPFQKKS